MIKIEINVGPSFRMPCVCVCVFALGNDASNDYSNIMITEEKKEAQKPNERTHIRRLCEYTHDAKITERDAAK